MEKAAAPPVTSSSFMAAAAFVKPCNELSWDEDA